MWCLCNLRKNISTCTNYLCHYQDTNSQRNTLWAVSLAVFCACCCGVALGLGPAGVGGGGHRRWTLACSRRNNVKNKMLTGHKGFSLFSFVAACIRNINPLLSFWLSSRMTSRGKEGERSPSTFHAEWKSNSATQQHSSRLSFLEIKWKEKMKDLCHHKKETKM